LRALVTRRVLDVARSLHQLPPASVPSALIQRLSEGDAQLVTSIASEAAPPVTLVTECLRAVRRLRFDRERAEIQREIDRLQAQGTGWQDAALTALLKRKEDLRLLMEEFT
ncbi:MAG: hypothetical protein AB7I13_09065, partial [Vicinamibacterales bacterium]